MSADSPTVLIVHDNEDAGLMYALCLSRMGFVPRVASIDEVLASSGGSQPDVVVADVARSECSGVALARQLRENARTRDSGIIVLTGHSNAAIRRDAQRAGCDRFLLKPCLPDELAHEIRELLSCRRIASP